MVTTDTTEDELGSFGTAYTSSKGTIAVSKVVMVALIATSVVMMVNVEVVGVRSLMYLLNIIYREQIQGS